MTNSPLDRFAHLAVGDHVRSADAFATHGALPPVPSGTDIVLQPGWTRYAPGQAPQSVPHPLESCYVFDTETFVKKGAYPLIGTAMSTEAVYLWLASEYVNPEAVPDGPDLIPVASGAMIIGHNVSYDRARTRPVSGVFWFDTMSAHVAVSGLERSQRWVKAVAQKPRSALTARERAVLKEHQQWLPHGCNDALTTVYNLHVADAFSIHGDSPPRLSEADKAIRDAFVKADRIEQLAGRLDLIEYALADAKYTAQLFQKLWPKYREATPTDIGLASQLYLNSARIPLAPDFREWVRSVDEQFNMLSDEASGIISTMIQTEVRAWQQAIADDIEQADLESICAEAGVQYRTAAGKPRVRGYVLKELLDAGATDWMVKSTAHWKSDPWLRQLDWRPKSFLSKNGVIPRWASTYLTKAKISTKISRASLLMRLRWMGHVIQYSKAEGFGYYDDAGIARKIPHPKDQDANVGTLLTKDFISDWESGCLTSSLSDARRLLSIAEHLSYWTSVRKRVKELQIHPDGVCIPCTVAHGTITRRTVEKLFTTLSSTKPNRIGTELKSRIQAPEGYALVGADFDSQEMQIASLYADVWEGCESAGESALAQLVLSETTDVHTALAQAADIDRRTAKDINFAMLYGAGVKTVTDVLKRAKGRDGTDIAEYVETTLTYKRGQRNPDGFYSGGIDSSCMNLMRQLAEGTRKLGLARGRGDVRLPVLGSRISQALQPAHVGREYYTSRANWTIQASGAELLAIYLVAIHMLAEQEQLPMQFVLSVHDEVWFQVRDSDAIRFALLMQRAHLAAWEYFHRALGFAEVPRKRRYFSGISVDNRVRKSPAESTTTLSHDGTAEPDGREWTAEELHAWAIANGLEGL